MEDRQKLLAAIMGAVAAYMLMETQLSSVITGVEPQPETNPTTDDSKLTNRKEI